MSADGQPLGGLVTQASGEWFADYVLQMTELVDVPGGTYDLRLDFDGTANRQHCEETCWARNDSGPCEDVDGHPNPRVFGEYRVTAITGRPEAGSVEFLGVGRLLR